MEENRTFTLRPSVHVAMRDGVTLSTDIWLPDGQGPWPVLLQRTPYRKETPFGVQHINSFEVQTALTRGFAVAIQDTRGRYASHGIFDPFAFEAADGADTIAWLRRQPFCNGRIGMFGASYVGATQVLALDDNPPGLDAVIPQLTTARHGETWMYRGGALELGFVMLWIIEALAADHLEHRPELPADATARARGLLAELQRDPASAFVRLPLLDEALVELAPYLRRWMDPARIDSSAPESQPKWPQTNRTPMLVIGGFNDIFVEGSIELFALAVGRPAEARAVKDRLILGPWSHGNPTDWQGEEWLGYAASSAMLLAEQLEFFDHVLNGTPSSAPAVRYFRSGSNSWHTADHWPPPCSPRALYLDCASGALTREQAGPAQAGFVSDPTNPVPTVGGATFLPGLLLGKNSGPMDQSAVEGRQDLLVFTSAPVGEDMDITGLVSATLWVSSSAPSCDWAVKFCEVDENGISRGIVDGILRRSKSTDDTQDPTEATVRLGHVSRLVRKGTKIRLQIASSNFPRFDRNPQSGVPSTIARASDFKPAQQTVFSGGQHASRLLLPILNHEHDPETAG